MAACIDIKEDLKAYVDGELGNGRRIAVRAHVEGCTQCARELSEIERYSTTLRTLDRAEPRPELRRRILASLPEDSAPVHRRSSWVFPVWVTAAAAAALAGFFLYRPAAQPEHPKLTASAPVRGGISAGKPADKGKEEKIALNDIKADQLPDQVKRDGRQPRADQNTGKKSRQAQNPTAASAGNAPSPANGQQTQELDSNRDVYRRLRLNTPPKPTTARPTEPEMKQGLHDQMDALTNALAEKTARAPAGAQAEKRETVAEGIPSQLGVLALKPPADADGTLVLRVDNLDTGLANVQALAREHGGTSQVLQKAESSAAGINLQVTLPADRVEALKSKLSEGNSVMFYSLATGGNQFGYLEQPTNGAAFGRAGSGGGGFGGGGGGFGATSQAKAPAGAAGDSRGVVKGQRDLKKDSQLNALQQQNMGKNVQQESVDRAYARKAGAPAQQTYENKVTRGKQQFDNNVKLQSQGGGRGGQNEAEANNTRSLKAANRAAPMFRLYIQLQQNPKTEQKANGGKAGN